MSISPDRPLISCLCVTENRGPFMPWLLWCYDRQTYSARELVIVDSSLDRFHPGDRTDIRVISMPPGSSIGGKRNRALVEARGEIITWFDDDDWQHPDKCRRLVEGLRAGVPVVGSREGWFVDLFQGRCLPHQPPSGHVLFNSAGFRKSAVEKQLFSTELKRASDTRWMGLLNRLYPKRSQIIAGILFFWLCHQQNISNPTSRRRCTESLGRLKDLIGQEAWGETDQQLEELRARLPFRATARRSASTHMTENNRLPTSALATISRLETSRRSLDPVPDKPAVSVVIKATVLDVPYLQGVVRHMIAQARFQFAERLVVVDRPRSFSGKYADRPRFAEAALEQVLDELLREGIIDRVLRVDYAAATVAEITERYFGRLARRVPTHASTGGPIYATLFGMESLPTDHVLQMDADVFFYSDGSSWVDRSLDLMAVDSKLWLMMTHPGPPAGPSGRSLTTRNARIAQWDSALEIWRFQHATTRYFLCDRRNLHGRLEPIWLADSCAPLEQCISRMLQRKKAFRGSLGDLRSWHLHAWYHGDPFPRWASELARAVESGRFPARQAGKYDLRLDQAADLLAWSEVIRKPSSLLVESCPPVEAATRSDVGRPSMAPSPAKAVAVAAVTMITIRDNIPGPIAPITVIIPVRNRGGWRLKNALQSLQWQSTGPPAAVLVVSHGSDREADEDLRRLVAEVAAQLITIGQVSDPWNKSLALNVGVRRSPGDVPYLMMMDADMILAPTFFRTVLDTLISNPASFVLCRSSDLPEGAPLSEASIGLERSLTRWRVKARLRPRYGTGGIQVAARPFFFQARGYDEELLWWGGMDGDMVARARLAGLRPVWIEDRTFMLHQWHPKKFRALTEAKEIAAAQQAWKRNHELVAKRVQQVERNLDAWGMTEVQGALDVAQLEPVRSSV